MLQLPTTYAASSQMTIKPHSREEDDFKLSFDFLQQAQMNDLSAHFCNRCLHVVFHKGWTLSGQCSSFGHVASSKQSGSRQQASHLGRISAASGTEHRAMGSCTHNYMCIIHRPLQIIYPSSLIYMNIADGLIRNSLAVIGSS